MAPQTKPSKKFTPNRFKRNKKQTLSRPILKNVGPFSRNSRHTGRPTRRAGSYPRKDRQRSRDYLKRRGLRRQIRLVRALSKRHRRHLTYRRKRYRRKAKPFRLWSVIRRKINRYQYQTRRRNRYWRQLRKTTHRGKVKAVIARHRPPFLHPLRAYAAKYNYRPSLHTLAKRATKRTRYSRWNENRKTVLSDKAFLAERKKRRRVELYYQRKQIGRVPVGRLCFDRPAQLRLQPAQQKGRYRRLNIRVLRKVIPRVHDRRKKKWKRARILKRPNLPRRAKQFVLARQLIRKLRSVPRAATRALRRRLLRHKRRYYRKSRTLFNVIRYQRRLRVKRRAVRRARRYLRSTATVLRGARARLLHRRSVARKQRTAYLQVNQRGRLLLLSPTTVGVKQTLRKLLFVRKEQRRRLRALRLIAGRALTGGQTAAAGAKARIRRVTAKLRRRLAGYTAVIAPRLPHPGAGIRPKAFRVTSTWLLRRHQRAQVPLKPSPTTSKRPRLKRPKPVRTPRASGLLQLKRYRTIRTSLTSVLRKFVPLTSETTARPTKVRSKRQQARNSAKGSASRLPIASFRAALAAFRAAADQSTFSKDLLQTSRLATLAIRTERARLLEERYYRTRTKLRLPNQRVRRVERKRQELRLFARHTLKKPVTLRGRAKLLLPSPVSYAVAAWQPRPTATVLAKDLSVPDCLRAYHPRVHFRGPRRYELGLILSSRLRKSVKKNQRYRRYLKAIQKKRKVMIAQPTPKVSFARLGAVIQKTQLMDATTLTEKFFKRLTFSSATQQNAAKTIFLSRLQAAYLNLSSSTRVGAKGPSRAPNSAGAERLALKAPRLTNGKRRELALWHLRSVQSMLNRERQLSAWSPQYGTGFRRWSSPRRYGRPMRTRKLSRLTRKIRRMVNKALENRNKPKRKYFDRSFGRVQYYRGSAASLGYARYRRVYRPRSNKNNRWWKPLKHAVPFAHPYSRRSLNAKKGVQVNLERTLGYRRGGAARTSHTTTRWLEPEEKPRLILSSTVKFKRKRWQTRQMFLLHVRRERAKMPFMIQRWLPIRLSSTGKVTDTARARTVLARTRRSIRKLERSFPKINLWAGRRWEALDRKASTVSAAALFAAGVRELSSSFWAQLPGLAGSQSKRAALQRLLFIRFRSWHASTLTTPVVGGLSYNQSLTRAVQFILTTTGKLLHGVSDSNLPFALAVDSITRRLASKQHRSWKLRNLGKRQKATSCPTSIYTKNSNALRRRWLHGAERYLKRSRVGRLPPRHRRGGDHRLTEYGRTRRRFPASGRRKQSYDSTLHAFAKRTSPSQFRRAAVTRFQRALPRLVRDSKLNNRTYELTRSRRIQRRVAHTLSRVAYLSPAWRELLTFREHSPIVLPTTDHAACAKEATVAAQRALAKDLPSYSAQYGHPFSTASKRRFASLPVNVLFKCAQLARRLLRSSEILPLRAHRIGLLRVALRRRRMERVYVDLKKHVSRRRLGKEQLSPSWKRRKIARKREKYLRYGDWTPRHFWMAPVKNISWTLHSLEERAPRRQDRALDTSLRSSSGELLLLAPKAAKRRNWAKKGFRIQLTFRRIKARRCRKVIRRRRRRSRHPRLGGFVKLNHWVERVNYNKILRRGSKMKKATARLAARQGRRSTTGLRFQKRPRRAAIFSRRRAEITKAAGPSQLAFQPATLLRFSSLSRRRGLKRLQRRAERRRSKFLRRRVSAFRRQQHRTGIKSSDTAKIKESATRALSPFTSNSLPRVALAPLTFVHPTRRVIKTEAEKRRAIIWNIKNKEIRYKKTAQYTESLTQFIPALMSFMISRHVTRKKLTYSYVKGLISATYWNLRIYLNVDPFAGRLALRDRNFMQLRFLTKAVARLSKEQTTEHADRMRLRWRFQPCRLQPAPTSDRFRLDWLRAFFPRKHALYQEDPEYYARAIVSSRNIRRVPLTGYGIGRARTYRSTISVERRARHLLRMRLSRREPRLETVLQTTRRVPETEVEQFVPVLVPDSEEVALEKARALEQQIAEADADIFARSKKFVFVKKARAPKLSAAEIAAAEVDRLFDEHIVERNPLIKQRTSFFQRNYSTTTSRALISTAKLISLQGRLSAIDGEQSTAFSELTARARVKVRLAARGRTNFIASTDFMINAGGLDPRFLRYKSPRSRQYGIRKPTTTTAKTVSAGPLTELLWLRQRREPLWPQREAKQILRLRRRHFYLDTPATPGTITERVLTTTRLINPARRIPTILQSRAGIAQQQILNTHPRNFPNRKQLIFTPLADHARNSLLRKGDSLFETRSLTKEQLFQHWRSRGDKGGVITGERAALLYRTPSQRSTSNFYRADRVLGYRSIQPRREVISRSRSGKRAFRTLGRAQRRYKRTLAELQFTRTGGRFKPKSKINRVTMARIYQKRMLGRATIVKAARLATQFTERGITSFRPTAFQQIARLSRFTRRCIIRQRVEYQTPFDTYRPQLWHMLTHRWMKKHRILKEWLKNVNLWFKDPWLSLLVDPARRGKRVPGEIRAREQQDGEVVTGGENAGYTGAEKTARVKAAHRAIAGALAVVRKDIEHTKRHVARASTAKKAKILMRLKRSRQVLRKPRPSMWLANLQCKRWVAEKAAWIAKSRVEQRAHRLEQKKLSIALVKQGKRRLGSKAAPLKVPADHFIPRIIWKDIQRRLRRLTWRESDDAFTRRGFRNAFKFYPTERNRVPWLEALMYNRSLYSTNLREFRRHQFPREQKKYKWLQRVRKQLFPGRTNIYIKGRRWPRLRVYNQKLHYSLFNIPDRNSARRHFKKLSGRSRTIGFVHAQEGLSNRLDNVLIHLNMAPTIFWARHVATRGLLRVNGKIAYGADYRLKAGDFIEPVWDKVIKYRHFFKNPLYRREEKLRPRRWSLTGVSRNFEYHPTIRCYTFLGNPREEDLRRSSRLQPHLFRWFRLDSGAKKSVT